MLTYFPTPYPGEWWYSVLCRYHVRSGNSRQQSTIKELFPGRVTAAMGAVFPNSTIRQLTSQLPPGIFDARDIILNHTLFPYYTRCYALKKKEDAVERLCRGETIVITSIRRFSELSKWTPRYCPKCAEEDRKGWGEAYWHITHQIPLMTLCPDHGCTLLSAEGVDPSRLDSVFYPLESLQSIASSQRDAAAEPWRTALCGILNDYATLPLESSATDGYSNLAISLSNMGYGIIQNNSRHTILDAKRLYWDLIDFFGVELVEQVFGKENSICTINRACKWDMASPERYALLQCFARIPSEVVFSQERIREKYEGELLRLQATGVTYGRKQLAEQLGITVSQLELLAKKYGIQPFWTQNISEIKKGMRKINFVLNEEELTEFKAALDRSGFRYDSHFARYCILNYIKEHYREG